METGILLNAAGDRSSVKFPKDGPPNTSGVTPETEPGKEEVIIVAIGVATMVEVAVTKQPVVVILADVVVPLPVPDGEGEGPPSVLFASLMRNGGTR
ncbi:unnamed protein product [Protopolystoma xenopodis]|uniref:Uncharacterized protein n=1 Tax=Protopolystoma xenopodis TaxID=117903 RepID=A0A3S5AQ22_9PLAT|nr:unnamed protein product [Protopolystoma xenopodis]